MKLLLQQIRDILWDCEELLEEDAAIAAKSIRGTLSRNVVAARQISETADRITLLMGALGVPSAVKSVTAAPAGLSTAPGAAVKALGGEEGLVGGYALRFGDDRSDGDLSQHRDIFAAPPKGYYGRGLKTGGSLSVPVYVHHGMLPDYGMQELTHPATLTADRVGLFVKHLLDLREPYEKALFALTKRGKLGFSTGAMPHLVERKALPGGRNLISRWLIGELSYTPSPAGGVGMDARAIKSLLLSEGVDLSQPPARQEPQPDYAALVTARERLAEEQHRAWLREVYRGRTW